MGLPCQVAPSIQEFFACSSGAYFGHSASFEWKSPREASPACVIKNVRFYAADQLSRTSEKGRIAELPQSGSEPCPWRKLVVRRACNRAVTTPPKA